MVCASPYDLALHDAYGVARGLPVYQCYGEDHCNADLSAFLEPAADSEVDFTGKYAADFLVSPRPEKIPVWHLVGGLDPLDESELKGDEPKDGYPVHLEEWIEADGLNCLKIKLRGNDSNWDYERLPVNRMHCGSEVGRVLDHGFQLHRDGPGLRQRDLGSP